MHFVHFNIHSDPGIWKFLRIQGVDQPNQQPVKERAKTTSQTPVRETPGVDPEISSRINGMTPKEINKSPILYNSGV